MADFPSHWVPLFPAPYEKDLYHRNMFPTPEQPLVQLEPGGSMPTAMIGGYHRPGVQGRRTPPVYHPGMPNPVQHQTRGRILLSQQNQVMRNGMPTHKARTVHVFGESIQKKRGGTGVYLPVPCPIVPATKPPLGVDKQENEVSKIQANKEHSSYQLPPEICLPEEWTY